MDKAEIRKEMVAKRAKLDAKEADLASRRIAVNLFDQIEILESREIGFYHPMKGEVDTTQMIRKALLLGKTVFLPKTTREGIKFYEFDGEFERLVKGQLGILEPAGTGNGEPETVVVPGLAFDLEKYRVGFGKGYYDAYLAKHRPFAIGVCYDWQLVNKLPHEKWDVRMDRLITTQFVIE